MPTSVPRHPLAGDTQTAFLDGVWRQIEDLVNEVDQLSRVGAGEEDFYAGLLERAVLAGDCQAGAVWRVGDRGRFALVCQVNLSSLGLAADDDAGRPHELFLASAVQARGVLSLAPGAGTGGQIHNPTAAHAIACPVMVEQTVVYLVELFLRPGISPDAHRGYGEILQTLCGLASDFHRDSRYRQLEKLESVWSRVERYAERVHASVELDATAYAMVNEGRRLVGCDRVALTVRRGSQYQVVAVSGIDAVDRRAAAVRRLEQLAGQVALAGEAVWYEGQSDKLSPQIAAVVEAYADESHAKQIVVHPLQLAEPADPSQGRQPAPGVLILDGFQPDEPRESYVPRVEAVCRHGAAALANALVLDRVPFHRFLQSAAWVAKPNRLLKAAAAAVALAVIVAVLCLVQAPFSIRCEGDLQPETRRRIFAPFDGRVVELLVDHGDDVASGQPLARIVSDSLELEHTRILGEIETTAEQLSAVEAARLDARPATATQRDEFARLAADEQRVKKTLENLREQQGLLQAQLDRQTVRSPITGQVLTWELNQALDGRPVQRGQVLMTVADTFGPWIAEVQVPDRDVSHLRAAQQSVASDLEVSFVLATHPETTYQGIVQQMSMISEPNDVNELAAVAVVRFDRDEVPNIRPGAGVRARIHCGQRSLGYVWLRDFLDALRRWLFV